MLVAQFTMDHNKAQSKTQRVNKPDVQSKVKRGQRLPRTTFKPYFVELIDNT